MIQKIKRYFKIYRILAEHNFSTLIVSRLDFFLLLVGKGIRMVVGLVTIATVFANTESLAGYSRGEALLFFATLTLMLTLVQALFFRGFWFTQAWVKSGEFDHFLKYPASEIFLNAFKITDWIDITSLIPAIGILIYAMRSAGVSALHSLPFLVTFASGLVIAFAIVLTIAATNFFSPQAEPLFGLFRELAEAARFPLEIYPPLGQRLLTIIPVVFLSTIPTKALLGRLPPFQIAAAPILATILAFLATCFWKFALRRYSSASS